jgi:hypothetical protein
MSFACLTVCVTGGWGEIGSKTDNGQSSELSNLLEITLPESKQIIFCPFNEIDYTL